MRTSRANWWLALAVGVQALILVAGGRAPEGVQAQRACDRSCGSGPRDANGCCTAGAIGGGGTTRGPRGNPGGWRALRGRGRPSPFFGSFLAVADGKLVVSDETRFHSFGLAANGLRREQTVETNAARLAADGSWVATSGDCATVHLYRLVGGRWAHVLDLAAPAGETGCFGESLAVQARDADNARVFVGAPVNAGSQVGHVYVFSGSRAWSLTHTFDPPAGAISFGRTIAANPYGIVYIRADTVSASEQQPQSLVMRSSLLSFITDDGISWRQRSEYYAIGTDRWGLSVSARDDTVSIGGSRIGPERTIAVTYRGAQRLEALEGADTFVGPQILCGDGECLVEGRRMELPSGAYGITTLYDMFIVQVEGGVRWRRMF